MKVVCICNEGGFLYYLTINKVYDIIEIPDPMIGTSVKFQNRYRRNVTLLFRFKDDNDVERSYEVHKNIFITIDEWREKQLDKLGI
jgi:hypothetical protein